jgi:hypothetical protein
MTLISEERFISETSAASTDSSEDEKLNENEADKEEDTHKIQNEAIQQRIVNMIDESLAKRKEETYNGEDGVKDTVHLSPTSKPMITKIPKVVSPEEKTLSRLEQLRIKKRQLEMSPANMVKLLRKEAQEEQSASHIDYGSGESIKPRDHDLSVLIGDPPFVSADDGGENSNIQFRESCNLEESQPQNINELLTRNLKQQPKRKQEQCTQIRIRVINESSRKSKDLVIDVSDKMNIYNSVIKRANLRKFKRSIVNQVKQNECEIVCCISTIHAKRSEEYFVSPVLMTLDQIKETSTKDLFNWKEALGYKMDDIGSMLQIVLQCRQLNKQPLPTNSDASDDIDEQLRRSSMDNNFTGALVVSNKQYESSLQKEETGLLDLTFDSAASLMEVHDINRRVYLRSIGEGLVMAAIIAVTLSRLSLLLDLLRLMVSY